MGLGLDASKGPGSDSRVPSRLPFEWLEGKLAMIRDQNVHPWRLPVPRSGTVQWAGLAQVGKAMGKRVLSGGWEMRLKGGWVCTPVGID